MQMAISKTLHTDGTGLWSNTSKAVTLMGLELAYVADESNFGELRVYFDTESWDIDQDGLIYTDALFLHELKHFLVGSLGLTSDVGYSEQGMQGDDYVSLDVGAEFINSFTKVVA